MGTTSDELGRARLASSVVAERRPVTGQRTVEGDVRHERIEYDGAELDTAEHDLRDNRSESRRRQPDAGDTRPAPPGAP